MKKTKKSKRNYFGTDGLRGIANRHPMTAEISMKLGKALAEFLISEYGKSKVVIGKDTRLSGYMFETALTSGLVSMGCDVYLAGPIPTPAVAHLAKSLDLNAGIMISASHNPADHNGIKIFDGEGYKLSDEDELEIESHMDEGKFNHRSYFGNNLGKAFRIDDARSRYIEFAKSSIGSSSLKGLKVVVDCANGAAYSVAGQIFAELGAEVIAINDRPDGSNINKGCGALHPEQMQKKVKKVSADLGIALDGDADRIIVCDENGKLMDGDALLAIFAEDLLKRNKLAKNAVVATVMSNLAFDEAMSFLGVSVVRAKVGDRYVIEEMRKGGYSLGGEQSGHIIFGDYSTTGDGILCGLELMRIMKESGSRLSALSKVLKPYPQLLVNVPVREKKDFEKMPALQKKLSIYEKELGNKGRILLRYSGTEKLARVMVEAKDSKQVKKIAGDLSDEIRKEIGL